MKYLRHSAILLGFVWLISSSSVLLAQTSTEDDQTTAVIGARVTLTDWSDPLKALGTLESNESVTLSATVTAVVASLEFEGGEQVKKDDVLVQLLAREERANLAAAEALREERRNAVNRLSQLQNRNLAPLADLEDSRTQLKQVEADIQAIQARLDKFQIRAPFDGVVGVRRISVGTLVTPGTELVTLDDIAQVKLDFRLPETQLGALRPGLSLSAVNSAYSERRFDGEIATIDTRVDPVSRSVGVRALLDNDQRLLRPGMLMRVSIARPSRETLVIPESALVPEGSRQYVWVVRDTAPSPDEPNPTERGPTEGGSAECKEVKIGSRREGEVEIIEGLDEHELIVSHGGDRLQEGAQVRLIGIVDEQTSVSEILDAQRIQDGS